MLVCIKYRCKVQMDMQIFLLLAICVTGAVCAPLHMKQPGVCAKQCLYPPADNLAYNASYTYEYNFVSKSSVMFTDHGSAKGEMDIQATIELSWLDQCNVIVQVKNASVLQEKEIMSQLLTNHPLAVGIQNGMVTDVCADPEDEPASLNFKKGIISQIQNSLPFFSNVFNNMSFEELDVVGDCLTSYQVKEDTYDEDHFIITKQKNHKNCRTHSSDMMTKITLPLWMSGLPIDSKSHSTCTQVIRHHIVESVDCEDVNEFLGAVNEKKRSVKAVQTSKLTFKRKTKKIPEYGGQVRITSIQFETLKESKNKKFKQFVIDLLKDVCHNMEGNIDKSVPQKLAKIISFLYRTRDLDINSILNDITSGKICRNTEEMETIFIDMLLIVRTSGSANVIMDKIKKGQLTGLRPYLYAVQLHLISKPSIEMIKAVQPAINDPYTPVPVALAAGSLVKKYCNHDLKCLQRQPIKNIFSTLSTNIISTCSNSKDDDSTKMKALLALKMAGNAGNLAESSQHVVLACLQSQDADLSVRLAAAEAFRQSQIASQVINSLSKMVQDYALPTEIRIASYLAIYSKANIWQLQQMLDVVKQEAGSQVRSFVLSHMRNLQLTDNPDLQSLRYSMLPLIIPQDFRKDVTKYSQNLQFSKYWSESDVGVAFDKNLVYSPSSPIPRQINSNLTTKFFGKVRNVFENGVRMENMESLMKTLFSPGGLLSSKVMSEAITKAAKIVQENGMQLFHGNNAQKQLKTIYEQVRTHISTTQGKETKTKLDTFIRLFGEEFGFLSFSGYPSNLRSSKMIKDVMENSMESIAKILIKALDKDYAFTYLTQFKQESFVPTVQGIPLQFKAVATFIARIYTTSRLNKGEFKAYGGPQGYVQVTTFMGYSFGAKAGIRGNLTAGSRNRLEVKVTNNDKYLSLELDSPNKQEIISFYRKFYLFNKRPGGPDRISGYAKLLKAQESMSCDELIEKKLGMKFCQKQSILNQRENGCYFSEFTKSFSLEKMKYNSPIIVLKGMMESSKQKSQLELILRTPGAKEPSLGMFQFQHENHTGNHDVVIVKYKTPWQTTRMVKASLTKLQIPGGNEYDLVVFSSNKDSINIQTDKVIKLVAGNERKADTLKVYLIVSTMKQFRKYVQADVNVEYKVKLADSDNYQSVVLSSIQLERFEVDLGMMGYRSTNYLRHDQKTNKVSVMSQTKGPKGLIVKMDSSLLWKGSIPKKNAIAQLMATVQTSKKSYEMKSDMTVTQVEKHFMMNIQEANQKKVAFVEANLKTDKHNNLQTMFEIDLPHMKSYQMNGSVKKLGPYLLALKLTVKKDKKPLYRIFGPVKNMNNKNMIEQKANLTMESIATNKYLRLELNNFSKDKETSNVEVRVFKTGNVLLGKIQKKSMSDPAKLSSKTILVVIPEVIDSSIKLKTSAELADLSADLKMASITNDSKRIKVHSHVSFANKKINAQLWLDANRQPNKKIDYSSTYSIDRQHMQILSKGVLKVYGDEFKYAVRMTAGSYSDKKNLPNEIDFKFINTKNKEMRTLLKYENVNMFEGGEYSQKYEMTAALKTFANQQYKLNGSMRQTEPADNSFYQTNYNMTLSSPRYQIHFGRKYDGPTKQKSMELQEAGLYSQTTLMVKATERLLCDMKLERKGKDVDINIGALIKSYTVQLHSSQQKALLFSVNENGAKVIAAECDVYSPTEWKLRVSSANSEAVQSSRSVQHEMPPIKGKILSKGLVELDIFKNAKPLTIQVALFKKMQLYYALEAVMQIPDQPKKPTLSAELGMSEKVNVLELTIKEDVNSAVLAKLEARRKHISPDYCNIEAMLKLPSETAQFAALVKQQSSLSCMGMSVNGSISTQTRGIVNVVASVCGPAYVELGFKTPKDSKMTLLKLGMKSYSSIKMAVDTVYEATTEKCKDKNCKCLNTWSLYENQWMNKENLFLIGAKLKHSQLINFLSTCTGHHVTQFKKNIFKPSVKVMKEDFSSFRNAVNNEVKQLLPKSLQLQPKVKEFFDVVIKTIASLPNEFKWWSELMEIIKHIYQNIQKAFNDLILLKNEIYKLMEDFIKWILGYELNQFTGISMTKIMEMFTNKLGQLEKKMIDAIIENKEKAMFPGIWKLIKDFLIEYRKNIIDDLDYVNDHFVPKVFRLFTDIIVKQIDDWLMNLKNPYVGAILVPLLSRDNGFWVTKDGGWLGITLPVKTPVASVCAAVSNIGFPNRQLALTLHRHVYPFETTSRKLALLTPQNIITFDGLAIPVIPSPCKILLIKAKNVAIEMEIISKERMELEVLSPDFITKIIITPNNTVKVVPLVKGEQHPDVKIERKHPRKVVLNAPGLTVWITDKSVLFESKLENPVFGILGSHDNEKSNDVPAHIDVLYRPDSPIATHQLSEQAAVHVFKKYRNNKHCQIHPITKISQKSSYILK